MTRVKRLPLLLSLIPASALVAAALAVVPAEASATIVQNSLTPTTGTAGQPVNAVLKVHSTSGCITVQYLSIGVRDSQGHNLDFPHAQANARICTSVFTHTDSETFAAGTYTEFGYYELNNTYYDFASQNLVISGGVSGTENSPAQPTWAPGGSLSTTFVDEFNGTSLDTTKWNPAWFEPQGYQGISGPMNPANELACENSANVSEGNNVASLELTNVASSCSGHNEPWTAGLITTQRTFSQLGGSFEARVNFACNSSGQMYGWPAWWITDDGAGEVDIVDKYNLIDYGIAVPDQNGGMSSSQLCGWHNLGAAWDASAQQVKFYWDDSLIYTGPFTDTSTPLFPVLDYTIDSHSVVPPSGTAMLVDWVRVWN